MCFITNTYLVVVKGNRLLFERSILVHIIQSLLCWLLPAVIVAGCIYSGYPTSAYKMLFIDFMTAGPSGDVLTYLSVTLPMQVTLSISLCLLWSVTWCIRRVGVEMNGLGFLPVNHVLGGAYANYPRYKGILFRRSHDVNKNVIRRVVCITSKLL